VHILILGLGNPSSLSQQKCERKQRDGVSLELRRSVQPLCKAKDVLAALGLMSCVRLKIIVSSVWLADHCNRPENVVKDMLNWKASAKRRVQQGFSEGSAPQDSPAFCECVL